MADVSTQLQIVLSLIDNASAQLSAIAENTNAAMGETTTATDHAGQSFGRLIENVAIYSLAYKAMGEIQDAVKDIFKGSFDAAVQASATMAQVKVDVDNAGLSYATLGPEIEAVAQKNTALGFSNEETQLSLGKLLLATGSYTDALKLNQLAMDLSRAKGIDLNGATVLIQQVMAGNTRALKQYGISLDSATTSGEALNMLYDKLKGSSDAFSQTAAGQMAEMQAQWQDAQVQIGQAFLPILTDVFNTFEKNLPDIIAFLKSMADGFVTTYEDLKAIGEATGVLDFLKSALQGIGYYLQTLKDALDAVKDEIDAFNGTTLQTANAQTTVSESLKKAIDSYNQLHSAHQISIDDYKQMDLAAQKKLVNEGAQIEKSNTLKTSTDSLSTSTKNLSTTFSDIPNHINAANNAMIKHTDAIAAVTAEYNKMQTSATSDLDTLTAAFQTKMGTIQDTIAKTQQSITDLTANYNQTQTADTASVADKIVASQQKVADLTTQLSQATTDTERTNLQKQLSDEQANLASSQQWQLDNMAAMDAAKKLAAETDLQRTINTENAKKQKDTDTDNAKLQQLKDTLVKAQDEATSETALYQQKVLAIGVLEATATAEYKKQSQARIDQTTAEVNAEKAAYQSLASTISNIKGASNSASVSNFIGPVQSVHDAIITPSGVVHTDPADYLIATKNPGALGGGGGGVTVNIMGGTYMDQQAGRIFGNIIAQAVNRQLKLRTI